MAHGPQCGHEGQEIGICELELFRFSCICMHSCMRVCTVFDILLAEEGENWTFY